MNLEAFKQAYLQTISESADDSDLKNYIRSIVKTMVSKSKLEESRENFQNIPEVTKLLRTVNKHGGYDNVDGTIIGAGSHKGNEYKIVVDSDSAFITNVEDDTDSYELRIS